jgi:hypothetical protein
MLRVTLRTFFSELSCRKIRNIGIDDYLNCVLRNALYGRHLRLPLQLSPLTGYAFKSAGSSLSWEVYTMTGTSSRKDTTRSARFLPGLGSLTEFFDAFPPSRESLGTKSIIIAERLMVAVSARAYGQRCKLLIRMPFDNAWLRRLLFQ